MLIKTEGIIFSSIISNRNSKVINTAGGDLEMEYDQESTYFKAHCLAHHVNDILGAILDSAVGIIPSDTASVIFHY